MSIARKGTSVFTAASREAPQTIARPTGTEKGNFLVAEFSVEQTAATWPSTIGPLELIEQGSDGSAKHALYVGYDNEAATYSLSGWTGTTFLWGRVLAYSGVVAKSKAKEAVDAFALRLNSTASTEPKSSSISPTGAEDLLLYLASLDESGSSFTAPSGMTLVDNTAEAVWAAEQQLSSSSATGEKAGTFNHSTKSGVALLAILPAAAGSKSLNFSDSTTPSESLTKKAKKALADSTTPTEAFTKKAKKTFTDSTTTSESWSFKLVEPESESEPAPPLAKGTRRTKAFAAKSRSRGYDALLLYAPVDEDEELENLGSVPLPPGQLVNGAALSAPGLIDEAPDAVLDGSSKYIDPGWTTRTNLAIHPWFDALAGYSGINGATATLSEEWSEAGPKSLKLVTAGTASGQEGIQGAPVNRYAVVTGKSYTGQFWGKAGPGLAGKGIGAVMVWRNAEGAVIQPSASGPKVTIDEEGELFTISVTGVPPAEAATAELRAIGAEIGTKQGAFTCWLDRRLVEESAIAGTYFPAPAQVESGEAGWSGKELESASDIGPFARGTQRTFLAVIEQPELSGNRGLFGPLSGGNHSGAFITAAGSATFRLADGTTPSDKAAVEVVKPAGARYVLMFAWDGVANSLSTYVNGVRKLTTATTTTHVDTNNPFVIGTFPGAFFKGQMLPFGVYPHALSEEQIQELGKALKGEDFRLSQKPPIELGVEIETAEGATFTLDADQLKAQDIPSAISFTTQRGDGFATASFTLNREILRDWPDLNLLDAVRFVARDGSIDYEGLIQSFPRTNDPQQQITVQCVGYMTSLKWRPMAALIIDSRLGGWTEPSLARKVRVIEAFASRLDVNVSTGWVDSGSIGPGISMDYSGVTSAKEKFDRAEAWFYAGGEEIGKLLYHFRRYQNVGASFYTTQALLATDDAAESRDIGPNYEGNTNASEFETFEAEGAGRLYAALTSIRDETGSGGVALATSDLWENPKVIGTHGLELAGNWPEVGFGISDVIEYLLSTYAPKIDWQGEPNPFVLQQATWHDSPATPYAAIQQLNNLSLWETNVWEERKFYFEPADLTKADWQIRTTDPGVTVNFQGDSIENFATGVVITYSDFFEHTYTLYPSDHRELQDQNENNAAARHGEDIWISYTIPWQCLETEALQFGAAYLAQNNRPKRPGSFTVIGHIQDAAGHWHRASEVRNSQTLAVMDDLYEGEPRLIFATSYGDESAALTITVDAPPMTIEAWIARQQSALEARNLTSA